MFAAVVWRPVVLGIARNMFGLAGIFNGITSTREAFQNAEAPHHGRPWTAVLSGRFGDRHAPSGTQCRTAPVRAFFVSVPLILFAFGVPTRWPRRCLPPSDRAAPGGTPATSAGLCCVAP